MEIWDNELKKLGGRNLSSSPITENLYNLIKSIVGDKNKRTFIFKNGPQILFDD
jgi:hypothetical protein